MDMKKAQEVEDMAKELGAILVKRIVGVDPTDPAITQVEITTEQKACCMMALSILYTRMGGYLDITPDTLVGAFLMCLQEAYPGVRVGMGMPQEMEKEDTGFLHFNKKPMVC